MGRKCSHCGNTGHNSRTCTSYRGGLGAVVVGGDGSGGLKLFGVQLDISSSSSSPPPPSASSILIKKSFSMDCLSSSSSPSSSSFCSSRISIDDSSDHKTSIGYLSDGLSGRVVQERKKGVPWTEEEHRTFLLGLEKLGKGDWRGIARNFVTTRTPTQVASHAQKYFLRQSSLNKKKRRSSLFDMVGSRSSHYCNDHQVLASHQYLKARISNQNTTTTTTTTATTTTTTDEQEETMRADLLGLNIPFFEDEPNQEDVQETARATIIGVDDVYFDHSIPFLLPKSGVLPSNHRQSLKDQKTAAAPDLELTLAAPTSLEGSNQSPTCTPLLIY